MPLKAFQLTFDPLQYIQRKAYDIPLYVSGVIPQISVLTQGSATRTVTWSISVMYFLMLTEPCSGVAWRQDEG